MQAFYEYLDAHHDQFLEELKRYLRQPSVAAQNMGMEAMALLAKERLEARGFKVQLLPTGGFPVVYGELGEGPKTLLIYDHYDVQPPEPLELWETPAFEPAERDGNLYARGVADNKGDQMCRMQAIEAWLATQGDLPIKIKWVIEGEEEIGSPNLEHFAREHAALLQADGCLWETGGRNELDQFGLWLGLKGIAYFELRLKTMDTDAHSANAPVLPNPAWRLVWALSTLKGPDDMITLDGYWQHVVPPTPDEIALVDRLPYDAAKIKGIYGARRFINDMDAQQAKRAFYFNPTLTICGFESGYTGEGTKTVLPKDARVKLDFRLVPDLTPDLVYSLLREHLDRRGFDDIEIVRFAGEHSAHSSAEAGVVQAAIRAARKVYGEDPVIYPRMPGSGPMYPLSNMLGIPAVLAGITHQGSKAHAPNEHIRLSEYWLGQKFIGEFIKAFAAV
jgi:acetylornithine deacetylase/succinyl-diaminopimelate desuccinylase-like protein